MIASRIGSDGGVPDVDVDPINRDDEAFALEAALSTIGLNNVHIYGPRGTGKTFLTHAVLEDLPSEVSTYYVSCDRHDTQYKVLQALHPPIVGDRIEDGHHIAELERRIAANLSGRKSVIVLDEIDFLLIDGDDLLYYLSRLDRIQLSLVLISATSPDLSTEIDDRTYSSLYPQTISFDPYPTDVATQILNAHANSGFPETSFSEDALRLMAATTTNTRLLLCWLTVAAEHEEKVTAGTVSSVKSAALQQYYDLLLEPFSSHHHTLLEAVDRLTNERETVNAGAIYDRYQEMCRSSGRSPLSSRRVSDFLTHLELLGIIDVDYHYGGRKGKTREIRLQKI